MRTDSNDPVEHKIRGQVADGLDLPVFSDHEWVTAPDPLVVVQDKCEGPWLDSIEMQADTPVPMRYWKVEKGKPSEYPGAGYLISERLYDVLVRCTAGGIETVPAMIETVNGEQAWNNYRFIKVPAAIGIDDLWAGKGSERIYRIRDHPAFVISSQVRKCIEAEIPGDLEFDQPILLGTYF